MESKLIMKGVCETNIAMMVAITAILAIAVAISIMSTIPAFKLTPDSHRDGYPAGFEDAFHNKGFHLDSGHISDYQEEYETGY
jgi:hypothetical protein